MNEENLFKTGTKFRWVDCGGVKTITFQTDDGWFSLYEDEDGWKDIIGTETLETDLREGKIEILND